VTELFTGGNIETGDSGSARATLRVVAGPNIGQEYPITRNHTKIGRSSDFADIAIPDKTVSRQHARIEEKQDGRFVIVDDGGVNRVRVDGELLPPAGERLLHHGAAIQLGAVKLVFSLPGIAGQPRTPTGDGKTDIFVYSDQVERPDSQTRPYEDQMARK
jgi:pSer/pThr/pTyr-binding forkhead associated (FHA) protein